MVSIPVDPNGETTRNSAADFCQILQVESDTDVPGLTQVGSRDGGGQVSSRPTVFLWATPKNGSEKVRETGTPAICSWKSWLKYYNLVRYIGE